MNYIIFTILGFCLGSTMFAYWIPKVIKNVDIRKISTDHNPGAANAYLYGGFWLGTLVLLFELGKGFVPVFLSQYFVETESILFVLILTAPVLGHAFPFFRKECGGKAIAVSFGAILGLFPKVEPFFYLAAFFIFFSIVLVINPHSFRSIITFGLFALLVFLRVTSLPIRMGCFLISGIVMVKHLINPQESPIQVRLFRHS